MKMRFIKIAACSLMAVLCMTSAVSTGNIGRAGLLSIDAPASPAETVFTKSTKNKFSKIKKSIAAYKKINKDVYGWLIVPGTNIKGPVLYSNKGNDYYVRRDWAGKEYPGLDYTNWNKFPATAEYLDYRTKFGETWKKSSRNTVIYGHNWNNLKEPNLVIGNKEGYTMFAQLKSYVNKDFASQNPYIYYSTENLEGIWKVFAVAYAETKTSFPYNSPNPTKDYYPELINEWKLRSMYNFDTEVTPEDRILTLSTCTRQYNVGGEQRYVVVARLLREGESENDKVKVTVNTKMKQPQF